MESYSQPDALQDVFALSLNPNPGFVVDIGCRDKRCNNSILLLKSGWSGVGADINNYTEIWSDEPNFKFFNLDVTNKEQLDKLFEHVPAVVEFLSLDVDEAGLPCLQNIDLNRFTFRCICIEHDFYIHGEKYRTPQREILEKAGYTRVVQTAAEDWWVKLELIDEQNILKLSKIPPHRELTAVEMPIILKWLDIK